MVQPIQYLPATAADPFANLMQGMKLGLSMEEFEQNKLLRQEQAAAAQQQAALRAAQEREIQAKLDAQSRLATASNTLIGKIRGGTATGQDFDEFRLVAPKDQSEAAMKVWEGMTKEQQQNSLTFGTQVMAALDSKNPQIGIDLLRQRAEAERRQGRDDQAKGYETMASLAELDPSQGVFLAGTMIGGLPGGKEAVESWTKTRDERRAAQLQPFKLREQTATTIIKEAEANLAPEKLGAELGLTNAQIAQAKAATAASNAAAAKSGAEARRADAEAKQLALGVIPADKRPDAEAKFRKEYSDQTKGYQEVKSAYGRVLSSDDSAVGDLSLIFGYMKMLDPGSVVREGEFATAQNAAGVPERIQNIYNKLISGERLSESQRKAFKGQAGKLYETAQTQEATVRSGIERMAKGYGLSPANIFYEAKETAPGAPVAPKPGVPSAAGPRAPTTPAAASPSNRFSSMTDQELLSRLGVKPNGR